MSMTYSDVFLTELSDKIFDQMEIDSNGAIFRFDQAEYDRIEREAMKDKIDELWEDNKLLRKIVRGDRDE